ncbi:TPA: hypothetical protein JAJ74_003035 [Legionella pneumophila]|nr:hypothetical protein [Legionella pneumophila]HAT6339072.1 hypothetical protein [Legionella pneumophila]HAT6374209.1 hypothetical protein [Legionella pneumophila]HAT6377286.1 hypothetical protein [Legionella pneumophila]HAT6398538.1 hypothetical protein [Legionella pneumophila]
MRRKRRNHSPSFKAKVAIAAIKGDKMVRSIINYKWLSNDWGPSLCSNQENLPSKSIPLIKI